MQMTDMIKVWDPLVRAFHWALAATFLVAYVTEDEVMTLHVWAGYTVLGLIAFRLVWGVIGSRYARFSNFVYRPSVVMGYLKDMARFRPNRYLGHNPAGGAMVVALLGLLLLTGLTGLGVYATEEFSGPLAGLMHNASHSWGEALEELHELFANATLLLVALHVAGVLLASVQHGENLIRSMFTGLKQRSEEA